MEAYIINGLEKYIEQNYNNQLRNAKQETNCLSAQKVQCHFDDRHSFKSSTENIQTSKSNNITSNPQIAYNADSDDLKRDIAFQSEYFNEQILLDKGFSETLFSIIDEKNLNDTDVYKKANIDRKLFSKIRSNKMYKPSKNTVLALCIALSLNLNETQNLLNKAGFTLSHALRLDVIVEYFILNKIYDIDTINEALYHFDERILGSVPYEN